MHTYECELGGRTLKFETGKLALQANASITVTYGETVVLVTVVRSDTVRSEVSYFPLMVDYEEKLYAAGKIKGSRFIKREGRPSDEAVTNARMMDRVIRPLFDQRMREDIQVVAEVLCYDGENDADVVAIMGASAAAAISDLPFEPVVSASRVGLIDGEFVANPSKEDQVKSDLDLVVASSQEKVVMIEASAAEVEAEKFIEAVKFAKKQNQAVIDLIVKMVTDIGKEKAVIEVDELPAEVKETVYNDIKPALEELLYLSEKQDRKKGLKKFIEEKTAFFVDNHQNEEEKELLKSLLPDFIFKVAEEVIQKNILENDKRIDGRGLTEIRPLDIEVEMLPRTHGTGYFKRGETQVLTVATLGGPGAEQIIDDMETEYKKRFMHHYNFPPFSVGEVQPLRGPSRRDIGHGMLAENALRRLMPSREDFPYTIRLVSEVFGSNGSSSMAATCGSSLALMDAGVPLKKHVAGVAMGIVQDKEGHYKVLTDLQDLEDSDGGMDFKVTGTKDGITAVQLDVKSDGLTDDMVRDTVLQNKTALIEIIGKMEAVIPAAKADLSPYAPRIVTFKINPDKIRDVIGPGGKMINEIINETGVEIDIEDDGTVMVTSVDQGASKDAISRIEALTKEAKVGEEYDGKVVRIESFGAFVELFPGTDGLIHISKLSKDRVDKVEDVVKMGDSVKVKVIEIDNMGRVNLMLLK
ncbi:polyribonucleotide nucleotidyltransferase [Patescibacteria group bacterium]|nr:polyribonucleotide nucleotidyltransferase [Patescibacteria group bacterium]